MQKTPKEKKEKKEKEKKAVKKVFKEFKDFAMRGNVLDMAVGVIIGAAFGKIVTSLVNDIIMPPLGKLLGDVDFSNLFVALSTAEVATLAEAKAQNIPVIAYGLFLNTVISFLIQAWAIFILVKLIGKLRDAAPLHKEEAPATPPRLCPYCCSEINEKATRCPHCTSEL